MPVSPGFPEDCRGGRRDFFLALASQRRSVRVVVDPIPKLGDHMASTTVSLLRFVSVALAAAALTLSSVGAGTLDAVKQAKTIRLAVRDDAPPFSYKDKTGQPAGFMVDLCRAVVKHLADDLSLGEVKIVYVAVTAADRFDAIRDGKADLLCEPTSETLSRRGQVDFTIPTFVDGASMMVKSDGPSELVR
jgi:ABC-type amino acid transport substrate-binding protein